MGKRGVCVCWRKYCAGLDQKGVHIHVHALNTAHNCAAYLWVFIWQTEGKMFEVLP